MKHDIAKIEFMSELGEAANNLNASIDFEEADQFIAKLYSEFQEVSKSKKVNSRKWIKERVKPCFKSLNDSPRWIESEPSWAYHEDSPMIFLSQTKMEKTSFTEEFLTFDEVAYLFGIRVLTEAGFEMKYVTITQQEGF